MSVSSLKELLLSVLINKTIDSDEDILLVELRDALVNSSADVMVGAALMTAKFEELRKDYTAYEALLKIAKTI
jgi:hypothetical protein